MKTSRQMAGGWLLAATLTFALGLAGCEKRGETERPPEPGDVVVARVQGKVVWASDVKREAVAQNVIGEGEPLDVTSDLFRRTLDQLIDQKLLAAEARRKGLDKNPIAQRRLAAAREKILGDMLVEQVVDNAVDDSSVRALYDEQLRLAKSSEEIRARLIQVKSQAEAQAVASLLATGASFEALAMEHSIDANTRFNGGDLGYFTTDVMPASYAAALKTAKAGDTVGPFQVEGGWALLRVEDRRQERPPTLEDAKPQILRFLTYDEVRQLLQRLRGQAKVEMLVKGDPLTLPGAPREPASATVRLPAPAIDPARSGPEATPPAAEGTNAPTVAAAAQPAATPPGPTLKGPAAAPRGGQVPASPPPGRREAAR